MYRASPLRTHPVMGKQVEIIFILKVFLRGASRK